MGVVVVIVVVRLSFTTHGFLSYVHFSFYFFLVFVCLFFIMHIFIFFKKSSKYMYIMIHYYYRYILQVVKVLQFRNNFS